MQKGDQISYLSFFQPNIFSFRCRCQGEEAVKGGALGLFIFELGMFRGVLGMVFSAIRSPKFSREICVDENVNTIRLRNFEQKTSDIQSMWLNV